MLQVSNSDAYIAAPPLEFYTNTVVQASHITEPQSSTIPPSTVVSSITPVQPDNTNKTQASVTPPSTMHPTIPQLTMTQPSTMHPPMTIQPTVPLHRQSHKPV